MQDKEEGEDEARGIAHTTSAHLSQPNIGLLQPGSLLDS